MHSWIARPTEILLACNDEQKEEYLYPCVKGDKRELFALTEPEAGSDVMGMKSNAIKKGDEVITTAWTFVAPIEAIHSLGAKPVLVNLDKSFSLDPNELESKITDKTKAIVSVPMWASPDMDSIVKICKDNDIILVEDAAQSLGAEYNGKKLGTFGELGSFSFDAGKSLHVGEGGMIVTNNKCLYDKVAEFSDHGHIA